MDCDFIQQLFYLQPAKARTNAYALGDRILIEVKDHCGGCRLGKRKENAFSVHAKGGGEDKTGVGLGLSIARQSVVADGGELTVVNVPGTGCIYTINLPRCVVH